MKWSLGFAIFSFILHPSGWPSTCFLNSLPGHGPDLTSNPYLRTPKNEASSGGPSGPLQGFDSDVCFPNYCLHPTEHNYPSRYGSE
jgi:hypothetical protein